MLEEKLSPLVDEETYPLDEQLAGNGILPVHEIADQDEQDDEYVEQQGRLQEEMMAQYQEGLNPVSASDRLDESRGALITSHCEDSGALKTRQQCRGPTLNNVVNGGDVVCPTNKIPQLIFLYHGARAYRIPGACPQGTTLSFTQGFLLGQLSIALILFFFIKFFIFGELPSADDRALNLSSLRRARTLAHQNTLHKRSNSNTTSNPLRPKSSRNVIREAAGAGGPSVSAILAKTYYNVKGHQPESLDWFNVLIAQTIAQLRADARQDGAVLTSLTEVLNTGSKPSFLGDIKVTEIALGDEFPIFSNCRVMPAEEGFLSSTGATSAALHGTEEGRLQARMDVDLSDIITLGIETTLVLNWPTPRVAILPVALAVSVVRFSGTLAVSFIPSSSPPSTPASSPDPNAVHDEDDDPAERTSPRRPTTLAFTFLDDYRLDLSVRSLVGSRSRLQDVPKIAQLIESRVHAWFDERAVEPRFQQIVLPSLWPLVGGEDRGGGGEVEGGGGEGRGAE
ncbi:hypothetical protein GRF29_161g296268 [Pseudopithomyces chartarum]|uniref:Maintenance of mitochondrial morphology protein 1 n=1 Tax=Pseudopithomyces chartarum TaxID=1892770 RepID=A0AAN6RD35_9PLEO|nr:hypothetical protein GRF29_161g296268 [Pseudopithomyces chartarum]